MSTSMPQRISIADVKLVDVEEPETKLRIGVFNWETATALSMGLVMMLGLGALLHRRRLYPARDLVLTTLIFIWGSFLAVILFKSEAEGLS